MVGENIDALKYRNIQFHNNDILQHFLLLVHFYFLLVITDVDPSVPSVSNLMFCMSNYLKFCSYPLFETLILFFVSSASFCFVSVRL